jgi:hypothetical protein
LLNEQPAGRFMYPVFFSDGLYQPEVACHPCDPNVPFTTRSV